MAQWKTLPQNLNLWELLHTLYHILSNSSTWLLFKAGTIPPSERERDEGHGSTSEGEEDRLEECVPPYIPALTFIVVWHCSYHQPTMLYSWLLLRGGIVGSSNLHAPPQYHATVKGAYILFHMRTDRKAVPDIYSWHCLRCLSLKADVIACLQVAVCVNWCFISFPSQGALTSLQVHRSQPEGMGGTVEITILKYLQTHTHTGRKFPAVTQTE